MEVDSAWHTGLYLDAEAGQKSLVLEGGTLNGILLFNLEGS